MAVCSSQMQSVQLEGSPERREERHTPTNGEMFAQVGGGLPLSVDYRSPVSHFVPPAVELYAARQKQEQTSPETVTSSPSGSGGPIKRKRGRPRVDKTSPEYLAGLAARRNAREIAAMTNTRLPPDAPPGEKRKRGRPRIDKTSPEYLARKREREMEALERKAKREYKRRTTGDSGVSSSAGDSTPRVKRKYTKRAPSAKKSDGPGSERVKGKRGRPRKTDKMAANEPTQQGKIRVRNNLMPINTEPISVDSDDERDLGSPGQASDSLSLDENLRAIRHIHEKYANIDKDDLFGSHLLAVNFKKTPSDRRNKDDDDVLSVRSSDGTNSGKDVDTKVENLEDSSDSDTSTSGSGSSSSNSSSSSSGSSSESSDEEQPASPARHDDRSFGAWSYNSVASDSGSESDPERGASEPPPPIGADEVSESDNESPDKSFQCHICRKWYSTRVTLKIHRRSHQSRGGAGARSRARSSDRYECDCCSLAFTRREKLWEHKAEAHRGSMTVRCEVCRKCFEDEAELAQHERTHTADERAGRCGACGATFARYEQLRRHAACAHGGGGGALPHACAHCGKRFGHAHSLTRHLHNHAKQMYRCVVCKASFARADQLAQHLNSHLANYKRLKP